MVYAVIGGNYGDEGKGLAVDYFASQSKKALVVRHNGGAQSGHTVEFPDRRFVFHELSSGSFRGADTYWAETFMPDLYKLCNETEAFRQTAGFAPKIFASSKTCITTIDDVLLNMMIEDLRGDKRHGSCGMGINEAYLRTKAGFGLQLGSIYGKPSHELYRELSNIRRNYTRNMLKKLKIGLDFSSEYRELLEDENVLRNYAEHATEALSHVRIIEAPLILSEYDNVIFENGQGLRLDSELRENYPHVTSSRTGSVNINYLCCQWGIKLDEAVYVTRSYLTRHGNGPLKNEISYEAIPHPEPEKNNLFNHWQGNFRYAFHESVDDLLNCIIADQRNCRLSHNNSLFITHLNETDNKMLFRDLQIGVEQFFDLPAVREVFDTAYLSDSRYAELTKTVPLPSGKDS